MDHVCFVEGCRQQPISYCGCKSEFVIFCTKHIQSHYDENENLEHLIHPLFKKIESSRKNEVKKQLEELLRLSNQSKSFILKSIADLYRQIEYYTHEILSYLIEHDREINKMLALLLETDKLLVISANKKVIPDKKFMQSQSLNFAQDFISLSKITMSELAKFIEETYEVEDKKTSYSTNFMIDDKSDDHLYFFRQDTSIFIKFNTINFTFEENHLNIPNQGYLAGVCKIPSNKVFYTGGFSPNLNTTYIIDLNSYSAEIMPQCRYRCLSCATYYNKSVYLFGGMDQSYIPFNNCDRFDLQANS